MTSANFGRAMDLSALKNRAPAPGPGGTPQATGSTGGSYVQELGALSELEAAMRKSLQHPVVLELYSAKAEGGEQLSRDLAELTDAAGGKWLLVRVDCDKQQNLQIAQALQVQAVPTVVAMIGGQPVPLFEGVYPKEQIAAVLNQVVQMAAGNGIVGRAEPVAGKAPTEGADEAQDAPDPRYAAAYDAMEAGDFARAVQEFDTVLAASPGDAEAQAGRAQASLLARSMTLTGEEVVKADANPDDLDAQIAAADAELVQGQSAQAFARLIAAVRRTSGDDRDRVRTHLLELFDTIGNSDPAVLTARRDLMTALF